MGKHIGIDLGTTNSVACFYDGRETRILLSLFQEEMTPSVVALDRLDEEDPGTIVVGRSAVSQAELHPRDTIFSIKRLMGRPFKMRDVQEWKARANYEIVEDERGRAAVMLGGQRKTPEEISAEILKRIKSDAERELGEPVTHAVITVPAYFGETEQAATRDAGRAAGLVVKQLLPDPTAAAIAFGTEARPDRRLILIYDLGGSAFDISIVLVTQGKEGMPSFTVKAVDGNHFLGGDDFDLVIVRMILDHVKGRHGLDLSADPQFLAVCKRHAEQAKKMLSAEERACILVPEAFAKEGKAVHIRMRVERAEFEKQIAPLVEKARGLVLATLKAECLSPDMIDDVLLVGGSTSVPLVEKSVEELFGKEKVRRSVNPTNCVAAGAAILAGRMRGVECPQCKQTQDESADKCAVCGTSLAVPESRIEGLEIVDIANNHFGFEVVKGEDLHAFLPLIEKGTRLPMREPNFHTFFITAANQRRIRIPVFEGQGTMVMQNSHIGVIEYEPPVELPIDQPVRVGLQLGRQSVLKVVIEVEDYNIHHEGELKREAFDVTPPPIDLDENVQFSVFRPRAVVPGQWCTMLAFAHLSEPREGEEQDPQAEVTRQASQILGDQFGGFQDVRADSIGTVFREREITFVPVVPGVRFNPSSRAFLWQETVHREEFRLRASDSLDGQMARGRLTVFHGKLILAELALSIRVDSAHQPVHAAG